MIRALPTLRKLRRMLRRVPRSFDESVSRPAVLASDATCAPRDVSGRRFGEQLPTCFDSRQQTVMEKQPFLADDAHEPRRQAARRSSPWIVCALVASIVLNVGALYRVLTWSPLADLDQTCGEYIEQHGMLVYGSGNTLLTWRLADSPLLDAVPVSYETVRYNGSLLKENIYRGAPSAETDAAWDDLGVNCEFSMAHQVSI